MVVIFRFRFVSVNFPGSNELNFWGIKNKFVIGYYRQTR
jgi:hypothetical protein